MALARPQPEERAQHPIGDDLGAFVVAEAEAAAVIGEDGHLGDRAVPNVYAVAIRDTALP